MIRTNHLWAKNFVCSECGQVVPLDKLHEHDCAVHPHSATDRCFRVQVDPKHEHKSIASLMFDVDDRHLIN